MSKPGLGERIRTFFTGERKEAKPVSSFYDDSDGEDDGEGGGSLYGDALPSPGTDDEESTSFYGTLSTEDEIKEAKKKVASDRPAFLRFKWWELAVFVGEVGLIAYTLLAILGIAPL